MFHKLLTMKTIQTKLVALFVLAGLFTTSCDKEDEKALSATQAKEAFATVDDDVAANLEALSNSPGFTAIEDLSVLTDAGAPLPFRATKEEKRKPNVLIRKAIYGLKHIATTPSKNSRTAGDESFDYNENTGVYAWNALEEFFEFVEQSNIIEIRFPTEGSTTNNAVFRLTAYDEVSTPDGDELYSPTIIEATLDIDGAEAASLSLDVEYISDGSDDPSTADITYTVGEFSVDVDYDNSQATKTSFSESLRKGNTVILGWGVDATYNSSDKNEENIKSVTGFLQLVNVRFTITVTQPGLGDENIEDYVKISITVDGNAAATIVWVADDNGEPIPYIKYTDDSTEPLEDVFEDFGEVIEDLDVL
jgi:hypothetical protein